MSYVLHALKSIAFSLTDGALHDESGKSAPVESARVSARPGGKAVFTIQNNDDDEYDVSIPFQEFLPSDGGPSDPINRHASGNDTARVPPRDVEVLVYILKPAAHFPFSPAHPTFHYKYTMHYTNVRTGQTRIVDPDLEVSP
jgi:hypothetical protein